MDRYVLSKRYSSSRSMTQVDLNEADGTTLERGDRCLWKARSSPNRWASRHDIQTWVLGKQEARARDQAQPSPRVLRSLRHIN